MVTITSAAGEKYPITTATTATTTKTTKNHSNNNSNNNSIQGNIKIGRRRRTSVAGEKVYRSQGNSNRIYRKGINIGGKQNK